MKSAAAVKPHRPEAGQGNAPSLRSHKTTGRTPTTATTTTTNAKPKTKAVEKTNQPLAPGRVKQGSGALIGTKIVDSTEIVANFQKSFLAGAEATEKRVSSSKEVQRSKRKSGTFHKTVFIRLSVPTFFESCFRAIKRGSCR